MTKLPKQHPSKQHSPKQGSQLAPSSTELGPKRLGSGGLCRESRSEGELTFDPKSGQPLKRTHLTKEKQCCGGDDSSRRGHQDVSKVPIVVPVSRRMDGHPPLDAPESEHPHCILPKHYFDAFLARARSQAEENGTRSLFSIETWEGRQVISYDSIES